MSDRKANIERLEKELAETKERLKTAMEKSETANEKLRTTNEELQVVNQKLKQKIEELNSTNSDFKNLIESTEVAFVVVDNDFRIRRFTEKAKEIFCIDRHDIGRSIQDFSHCLRYESLEKVLSQVLAEHEKLEKVVSSVDGHTYIMDLSPYNSLQEDNDGVLLTFTEISGIRNASQFLQQQKLQEALATMGTYALGKDDLDSIMHRALQQVCLGVDADYALLLRFNPDEWNLHLFDYTGWEPDEKDEIVIGNNPDWDVGYVLKEKKMVTVTNYAEEDRFALMPLVNHLDIQSGVTIVITESDEVCGVMSVYSEKKRNFSNEELNFVKIASNIIGTASEREKTKKSLKETNKQLEEEIERSKKYQREILKNSIIERWNLGGYLHDTLAQILVSIKVMISSMGTKIEERGLDMSSQINLILDNLDEGIEIIRNLTHEIIPVDIEEEGVEHAFRLLVRQLQKNHDINCILEINDIIKKVYDKKVATNLYHVIQEAVKNAAIHGEAENVVIETVKEKENLKLQITDDGIGLSNTEYKKGEGSGTNIMRHRIELLGGSFNMTEVEEEDYSGTRIICMLPLESLGAE